MINTNQYRMLKQFRNTSCIPASLSAALGYLLRDDSENYKNEYIQKYTNEKEIYELYGVIMARSKDGKSGFEHAKDYVEKYFGKDIQADFVTTLDSIDDQWELIKKETDAGNPVLVSYATNGGSHINGALKIENDNLTLHEPGNGSQKIITKEEYLSMKWDTRPLVLSKK